MPPCLTQYGMMAEKHWREHLPQRVRELEAQGQLLEALFEAEEKTKDDLYDSMAALRKQGCNPQQAHDTAWEMVRERYILLPPEET